MRRVAAKFVPRLLTPEHKEHRVAVCQDLGDESWVYGYDPETKWQSSQWKSPSSPRPKKVRMSRSSTKTMLIVFFDICSIVHRKFVPQGQTVNKKFYCEVLRHLRENIRRKRSDLWCAKNWILHNDNAPCHRALLVREFLTNHNMLPLPHPPYSPDLAPAYIFLFPKMKMQLKGRRFHRIADIQRKSQKVMDSLTPNDFKAAFQQWQEHCDRCIAAQGDYFEGDGVQT
jgi:histone-lysine N-methyltransferase SETMAR